MKITAQLTDDAVLQELGARIARLRLDQNLTQAEVADLAGVGKRTIERLEAGQVAAQLSGFVRVCRVLGIMDRFEAFLPEPAPSPMAQLRLQGRARRRATGRRTPEPGTLGEKKWTWGE
jgi:transcriptional regulator with XRE-family HTH domain